MANDKIDMENLFNKFLTTYKRTHVNINGQQAQIECSIKWRELKKGRNNISTKSEAEKLMLQWKQKARQPVKGSIVKFLTQRSSKKEGMQYNLPDVE